MMSNSEICALFNSESSNDIASTEIFAENDSALTGTSFDNSVSRIEVLETCPEISFTNDDVLDTKVENSNCLVADSGILDYESIIDEDTDLKKFENIEKSILEKSGVMTFDFNCDENGDPFEDEEYHDAVNFFNDPLSLSILENAGSSTVSSKLLDRSSLYRKFDPLYAKLSSNVKSTELQQIMNDEMVLEKNKVETASLFDNLQSYVQTDEIQEHTNTQLMKVSSRDLQNNGISQANNEMNLLVDMITKSACNENLRQSLGNLLSFDSTIIDKTDSVLENSNEKIYTEKEFQQGLKNKELLMIGTFLKDEKCLENSFLEKQQDLETKLKEQMCLTNALSAILKEAINLVGILSDKEKVLEKKLEISEKEREELKKDLAAFVKDLLNVKNKFYDFQKDYEQIKTMLKLSITNESLLQQMENISMQLDKKDKMYKDLYSRSQAIFEKAETKVFKKEACDSQTRE